MRNTLSKIPLNVIGLGFVGFFMQFGASLVYATGNVFVEGNLLSDYQLILVRGFSESLPHIIKVFSGYISDRIKNRKLFLMVGYGSMIFFKLCFFICSLTHIFPVANLAVLYVFTQILDRIMNSLRDGPRDALISDSTPKELLSVSFALRKSISSLGSISSGITAFLLITYTSVSMPQMYGASVLPVIISTLILYYMIKDVQDTPKETNRGFNWVAISKHLLFNGLVAYGLFGYNWKSWTFFAIYSNLMVIYNNFDKLKHNNYEPMISAGLIIVSLLIPEKYSILTGILGLLHFNKSMVWVSLAAFIYTILITFMPIKPIIITLLTGLGIQTIKYLRNTSTYTKVMEDKPALNKFFSIAAVSSLLVMGKINDSVYYKQVIHLGLPKPYTILLFVTIYIVICMASIVFGYMLKRNKYYWAGLIVCAGIIGSNILLTFNNSVWFLIASAICGAIYNGGMEIVFTTMIARTIPSREISGTLFGAFYTLIGIFNFVGVTLLDYAATNSHYFRYLFKGLSNNLNNLQIASKVILIFPILGTILFLYKYKEFNPESTS